MSSMIQIRNVPDDVHRKIKARAALEGKSLSEYLLPSFGASRSRRHRRNGARASDTEPVLPTPDAADAVRAERDSR